MLLQLNVLWIFRIKRLSTNRLTVIENVKSIRMEKFLNWKF